MKTCFAVIIFFLSAASGIAFGYTNTDIIYAQALAKNGIIVDHSADPENYRFDDSISRAELTSIALKIRGTILPEDYSCKKYYTDVTVNDWICRAVELSADAGLISREKTLFNPNRDVSKSEALSILMKSMGIPFETNASRAGYTPDVVQWQVNVLESALKNNIISSTQDFYPNRSAKRSEVFSMAVSIAISITKNNPSTATVPTMIVSLSATGDSRKWTSQYTGGNAVGYIEEFTPDGDTLELWKELITRRVDFVPDTTVDLFVETWKNELTKMDKNITIKIEPVIDETLIATYASEKLNERGIAKFFDGTDGVYMILYSSKFKNYNTQYFKTWSKNIRNATLIENTVTE